MKKNVFIFSALCFATMTLVFSGCKKENNDPQEPAKVQTYQMSIQASKGTDSQANGPRRVLSLDGNTLNAAWQAGEQVSVYNETKGALMEGYLVAEESGASTRLSGELTGSIAAGDMLTLKYLSPDYATQLGTIEYISANCDYAVAENVEVISISGGTIYTVGEAAFENRQAVVKFTLLNKADDAALSGTTQLVVKVGEATYTVTPASATSEMYVALPGFAGQTVTLTATVGSDTYAYEKTGATFENGKFYPVTAKLTKHAAPAYKEYGPFSVSPTLKVYFSQGNLQYQASTNTWRFAENQYDAVGGYGQWSVAPYYNTSSANHSPSESQTGWIDLFGWATSNLNTPVSNTYYQPWNTSYGSKENPKYGSTITTANVSWATARANYDWGANTGDLGTGWRTLTAEEWGYLIGPGNGGTTPSGQRDNYQSLRGLCKITVSGTDYPGMIILPDGLNNNLPAVGSIATKWAACAVEAGSSLRFTNATFTEAEWTALQEAGAAFLPAAGGRSGTAVLFAGALGYYWSSTASSDKEAFYLYFYAGELYPENGGDRSFGRSVRLVKNAN